MIEDIRKHSKLIIWIFVFVSIMFIGEEGLMYFIRNKDKKDIVDGDMLIIDGERIKYSDFKRRYDERMSYASSQFGITTKDYFWAKYFRDETIRNIISNVVYKHMARNLGIKVGNDEIKDLVQGQHVSKIIKESFKDQYGRFDKGKLIGFLNEISNKKESLRYWNDAEQEIRLDRNKEKIEKLLASMSGYNLIEAKHDWDYENTKFDVEYLYVPFTTIDDKECTVTDEMLNKCLLDNKHDFQDDETYKIQYLIADYKLSDEDIKNNRNNLENLKNKFSTSSDPLEFAKIKSDKDIDKDIKTDNSLKLVYKDLPEDINKNNVNTGDVFVTIAKTMKDVNKIYRIIKIEDVDKNPEERSYEVNIIYKKPFINKTTEEKTIKDVDLEMSKITKIADFEKLSNHLNIKIKKKTVKIDDTNIDGVDDARKFIHELAKKYKKPSQKDAVFTIKPFKNTNGIFCGIVTKHNHKGLKDLEDVREDLTIRCIQDIKYAKIMDKIKSSMGDGPLTYDEIKNKKSDFIKIGTDKDFGHKNNRLKNFARAKNVFNSVFYLDKNDTTNFIKDESGAIMVKIIDKKNKKFDINNPECKKFYEDKCQDVSEMKNLKESFKKRFNIIDNKNDFI